jgi:hypothetical protein
MAHNEHVIRNGEESDQLVRQHAGAHLGALLNGLRLTAVKFNGIGAFGMVRISCVSTRLIKLGLGFIKHW